MPASQFLAFRVIWPAKIEPDHLDIPNRDDAMKIVSEMDTFQEYLKHIHIGLLTAPPKELGVFQLARDSQLQVGNELPDESKKIESASVWFQQTYQSRKLSLRPEAADSQAPHKEFEKTQDEQIVNDALLELLKGLVLNLPNAKSHWCSARLPFKVSFDSAEMEAQTDGYLGKRGQLLKGETFAILEAKARVRTRQPMDITIHMQESAEMVGWIRRDQTEKRKCLLPAITSNDQSRLLIAQDRQEIFVVIATFNKDYARYLEGKSIGSPSFMTMQEYGPFQTASPSHMERFAQFVIGFCIEVDRCIMGTN